MVLNQYDAVLRKHDDPARAEYPSGFNWKRARARAVQLRDRLASNLEMELVLDDTIQDASFSFDIELVRAEIRNMHAACCVRLSNFGSFATITIPDMISAEVRERVIATLDELEYVYVPAEELDRDYDGAAPADWRIESWWVRFFDYL